MRELERIEQLQKQMGVVSLAERFKQQAADLMHMVQESHVANGGELDFKKGNLQLLKDRDNADAFLLLVVKSMLRHPLREPYLYRDIREC